MKSWKPLWVSFLGGLAAFILVAGTTHFGKIMLYGDGIIGSDGTERITFSTTSPHVTITGDPKFTGSTYISLLNSSAPRSNVTPFASGELIYNSTAKELCMSTGTVATSWVKITTGTSVNIACDN